MSALLLSSDLIFSSRFAQAARGAGVALRIASSTQDVLQQVALSPSPRLLILDLSTPDCDVQRIVAAARNLPSPPTVAAYASHVLGPLLEKARQGGCDLVFTRGQLARRMDELVKSAATG
jgi:CheY-like chemotaxis protein